LRPVHVPGSFEVVLVFRRENNGDALKQSLNHFTTVDNVKLQNSSASVTKRLFKVKG